MDISIVIDKSTFQSLTYSELYRLSCYFKHIITPVLVMEILGDLKKESVEGKPASDSRVKDFASKLFPLETIVSEHYKHLVKADLLGKHPVMDGRPNVSVGKTVQSSSGQRGIIVEETVEEKAIYNWKEGRFTEADRELSAFWRMTTTNESVLRKLQDTLRSVLPTNLKSFEELDTIVEGVLLSQRLQESFLFDLMQNYDIDPGTGITIWQAWVRHNRPLIKNFAPYAFHCLRVDILFLFGLASNLIGTRPTNRVDLEYLYYQPFGHVFTSNDKVHINLVPLLLRPYQKFITGPDLKADFKTIVGYLDGLDLEERKRFKDEPPVNSSSVTFQLWNEYFGYPNYEFPNGRKVSESEFIIMKEKMKELEAAMKTGDIGEISSDNTEFVAKVSYMSKHDPCYCGSGKKVIDCCIPDSEFDKIIQEQKDSK